MGMMARLERLENEVTQLRKQLQSTVAELNNARAELKAAKLEMQSLKSTSSSKKTSSRRYAGGYESSSEPVPMPTVTGSAKGD